MKAGDKAKFTFGKAKKEMEGQVERAFEKTVYIRVDFPKHKGKIVKRRVSEIKA
jgi:hypothetical protein